MIMKSGIMMRDDLGGMTYVRTAWGWFSGFTEGGHEIEALIK